MIEPKGCRNMFADMLAAKHMNNMARSYTLSQQTRLATLQIEIAMRRPYLARVQSSSAASHVLRSMYQAISGEPLAGAFGDSQSQVLVIVSSDFYVAGLAGLLDLHWLLPGYQPDFCAPGGALVFELRQERATEQYLARVFEYSRGSGILSHTLPPAIAMQPTARHPLQSVFAALMKAVKVRP